MEEEFCGRFVVVLTAVFVDNHRHEIAGRRLIEMVPPGICAIPRPESAPEHDTFTAGEEHLRGTNRKAVVARGVAALVGEAYIADAAAHVGKLPRASTVFVVSAR